jgi:hypothetical protein
MAFTPQSLHHANQRADPHYFARWNPAQYLAHYYSEVESEERHTLRFLVSQIGALAHGSLALEFGIGPTLHHLLPLAERVSEVHVADLLPANLQAIRDWQQRKPTAHDWSAFTRQVMRYEGAAEPSRFQIANRENLVRRKISRYLQADADCSNPAGVAAARRYDCVLSCYCADSATPDKKDWFRMMQNIAGLVAPGGLLIVAALRLCPYYTVGGIQFPSANIDDNDLLAALLAAHCDPATLELQVQPVPDRTELGFQGILLAAARLR